MPSTRPLLEVILLPLKNPRLCKVKGCDGVVVARGWCRKHYGRWYVHGSASAVTARSDYRRKTTEQRFWAKVDQQPDGCWLWTAYRTTDGYGRFRVDGVTIGAHRWAYEHFVGPISDGLTLDHLCRVRHCVNPEHLEPVTQGDNTRRGDGFAMGSHNRTKTHCKRNHPFDEANTIVGADGSRRCRKCHNERRRDRRR